MSYIQMAAQLGSPNVHVMKDGSGMRMSWIVHPSIANKFNIQMVQHRIMSVCVLMVGLGMIR
jgi:hypothetical protein